MRRACNKCANGFSVPPPLLSRLTAFIRVHRHAHSRHTRTCTYAHSVRAFALTRTAGTLKDVETRNRLQLDSTSRPAGHKTWPRLKRIASSFSISLSLSLFRFPALSPIARFLLPSLRLCILRIAELRSIYPRNGRKEKEDEKRRKIHLLVFWYFHSLRTHYIIQSQY